MTLTALGEGVRISGEATLRVMQNEPVTFLVLSLFLKLARVCSVIPV